MMRERKKDRKNHSSYHCKHDNVLLMNHSNVLMIILLEDKPTNQFINV